MAATRPHPDDQQTGQPLKAKPCRCDEPAGDPRDGVCIRCGRQIAGIPIPGPSITGAIPYRPSGRDAPKRRRYHGAP